MVTKGTLHFQKLQVWSLIIRCSLVWYQDTRWVEGGSYPFAELQLVYFTASAVKVVIKFNVLFISFESYNILGSTLFVVIVVGNRISDPSSIVDDAVCVSLLANVPGKTMNLSIIPTRYGYIVGQSGFFSLG